MATATATVIITVADAVANKKGGSYVLSFLNYFNRGRVRTVDNFGIPVLRTNYVTTDTTTTSVTYGICPKLWRQLPCQGLFILHVTSTPASAATPTDLVFLDPTCFTNR